MLQQRLATSKSIHWACLSGQIWIFCLSDLIVFWWPPKCHIWMLQKVDSCSKSKFDHGFCKQHSKSSVSGWKVRKVADSFATSRISPNNYQKSLAYPWRKTTLGSFPWEFKVTHLPRCQSRVTSSTVPHRDKNFRILTSVAVLVTLVMNTNRASQLCSVQWQREGRNDRRTHLGPLCTDESAYMFENMFLC